MTEHCRKSLTFTFTDKRKSLLVIQIQEALWTKFKNNLKVYLAAMKRVYVSKEVKVNAVDSHQKANHSDQK